MKKSLLLGLAVIAFGLIGITLICVISLLLYGKVYMYNGYEFTGVLWTICFIIIGFGVICCIFSLINPLIEKNKFLSEKAVIIYGVIIGVVISVVITVVLLLSGNGYSNQGETCGACGGSGHFFGNECPSCHGFGIYVD